MMAGQIMNKQDLAVQFSQDPLEALNKKLDKFFWLAFSVGFIFVVSLLAVVITLLVDSFHFNSATYREYSEKIQTLNALQEENVELQNQNQKNQELILEMQKEILNKMELDNGATE